MISSGRQDRIFAAILGPALVLIGALEAPSALGAIRIAADAISGIHFQVRPSPLAD
jgi:hypothetical protein